MKLTRTFQMIQIKVLLPCQLVRRFDLFYDHQDFRRKFFNEVGVLILKKGLSCCSWPCKSHEF